MPAYLSKILLRALCHGFVDNSESRLPINAPIKDLIDKIMVKLPYNI